MDGFWVFPSVLSASCLWVRGCSSDWPPATPAPLSWTLSETEVSSKPLHKLLWSWCFITAVVKKPIYQLSYNTSSNITFQTFFLLLWDVCACVCLSTCPGGKRTTVRSRSLTPCFWDRISPTVSAMMYPSLLPCKHPGDSFVSVFHLKGPAYW